MTTKQDIINDLQDEINREEGIMESKKWYQSKTIWTSIVMISISLLSLLADINIVPAEIALKVSGFIGTVAGAFGIYLRTTSDPNTVTKLTK